MYNWGKSAIFIAAENGRFGSLKLFIDRTTSVEECISLIEKADNNGVTPLMIAAQNGHLECLQLLIEKGADVNRLANNESISLIDKAASNGVTPLMIAAENGHIECLRLLIEKGADVNRLANNGTTALNLAIECGHLECVKLLRPLTRKELKFRICVRSSYTCVLHSAVRIGNLELLCLLLDDGLDLSACVIRFQRWNSDMRHLPVLRFLPHIYCCFDFLQCNLSLLSSAVEANRPECVLEIIRRGGEVNPTSNRFLHPLIIALSFNNLNMVRLLLDNGANPNFQFKSPQCSIIRMLACSHLDALIMILKCGGDMRSFFPERDTHVNLFRFFNPDIFNHLNCVRYTISSFTGTSTNLSVDVVPLSCQQSCANFGFKRKAVLTANNNYVHDDCLKLISGIDSTSLKHRCRIKIVQTVLEANHWAPLLDYLKRLPIPPILINYLLYKDDQ